MNQLSEQAYLFLITLHLIGSLETAILPGEYVPPTKQPMPRRQQNRAELAGTLTITKAL
jgi:hypothetical protein